VEVVREGRKATTSQGSGMANQPPVGSQGSQYPSHHGGSGGSNLRQRAGEGGGYHPGFNPSYHLGANRGWQGGGRGRRGDSGGHAHHGFAGRSFDNNFFGAGRGCGGHRVGQGRGGEEWGANPMASRSLTPNAPAKAPASTSTTPILEGTMLNS